MDRNSRTNSLTSISTAASHANGSNGTPSSVRNLSTSQMVSIDNKFMKKSTKKNNEINFHKSQGTYFFPNGEVFRPRLSPSRRSKPSKMHSRNSSLTSNSSYVPGKSMPAPPVPKMGSLMQLNHMAQVSQMDQIPLSDDMIPGPPMNYRSQGIQQGPIQQGPIQQGPNSQGPNSQGPIHQRPGFAPVRNGMLHDNIPKSTSLTSVSTLPKSHSSSNLNRQSKHNLAHHLRSSKADTATNINILNYQNVGHIPHHQSVGLPYQQYQTHLQQQQLQNQYQQQHYQPLLNSQAPISSNHSSTSLKNFSKASVSSHLTVNSENHDDINNKLSDSNLSNISNFNLNRSSSNTPQTSISVEDEKDLELVKNTSTSNTSDDENLSTLKEQEETNLHVINRDDQKKSSHEVIHEDTKAIDNDDVDNDDVDTKDINSKDIGPKDKDTDNTHRPIISTPEINDSQDQFRTPPATIPDVNNDIFSTPLESPAIVEPDDNIKRESQIDFDYQIDQLSKHIDTLRDQKEFDDIKNKEQDNDDSKIGESYSESIYSSTHSSTYPSPTSDQSISKAHECEQKDANNGKSLSKESVLTDLSLEDKNVPVKDEETHEYKHEDAHGLQSISSHSIYRDSESPEPIHSEHPSPTVSNDIAAANASDTTQVQAKSMLDVLDLDEKKSQEKEVPVENESPVKESPVKESPAQAPVHIMKTDKELPEMPKDLPPVISDKDSSPQEESLNIPSTNNEVPEPEIELTNDSELIEPQNEEPDQEPNQESTSKIAASTPANLRRKPPSDELDQTQDNVDKRQPDTANTPNPEPEITSNTNPSNEPQPKSMLDVVSAPIPPEKPASVKTDSPAKSEPISKPNFGPNPGINSPEKSLPTTPQKEESTPSLITRSISKKSVWKNLFNKKSSSGVSSPTRSASIESPTRRNAKEFEKSKYEPRPSEELKSMNSFKSNGSNAKSKKFGAKRNFSFKDLKLSSFKKNEEKPPPLPKNLFNVEDNSTKDNIGKESGLVIPEPEPESEPVKAEALTLPQLPDFDTEENNLFDDVLNTFDEQLKDLDNKSEPQLKEIKIDEPFLRDDELSRDQIEDQQKKDQINNGHSRNTSEDYTDENLQFLKDELIWPVDNVNEVKSFQSNEDKHSLVVTKSNETEELVGGEEELFVIDNEQLNNLFDNINDHQRRKLPMHLKYIKQFKDYQVLEINVKKFENLTNSKLKSNSRLPKLHPKKLGHENPHRVQFSNKISINETFAPDTYSRYNRSVTQYTLTEPIEITRIKNELNNYKCNEMLVHERSQDNTHFFY